MSSQGSTSQSGGSSLIDLLGILFIALKLTGVITWPWIWVLAPFWAGLAVVALVLISWGAYAIVRDAVK